MDNVTHSGQGTQASFQDTHWSVVLAAGQADSPKAAAALEKLCRAYWPPLYAFLRRRGYKPDEAQDLTQEFFAQLLKRNALATTSPDKGRFRSFLLTVLKHFLLNEWHREQCQKRGGGRSLLSLDGADEETRYALEPADGQTPEMVFERRWALAVVEQTMGELRREYTGAGKGDVFEELQGFLPCGKGGVSRAELAAKRGVSVGAIDVAVHRLRQRFGALLREQVAQTVSVEAEVDEEIRYLISVIGG